MPFVQHICFSNTHRFDRRIYYIEYNGLRFKLIQHNPRTNSDVLLAVHKTNDNVATQRAYAAAAELLSAISWRTGAHINVENCGGIGRSGKLTLRQAHRQVFNRFLLPGSFSTGHSLSIIPHIATGAQRRALVLMREARSANKVWLKVLFYWQVLDVAAIHDARGRVQKPAAWVNAVVRAGKVRPDPGHLKNLDLGPKDLGTYLEDDCRHAIAHLRRFVGRREIGFDIGSETRRMNSSAQIAEDLAEHYVTHQLGLREERYLMRVGGRSFPVYLTPEERRRRWATIAYRP